jgi:N-acetylglutamate synthase-like GNAT family acetyltransferase
LRDIALAQNADLDDIRAFYEKCGYGGGVDNEDTIAIAREDGKIVGAVRLCNENGIAVLRGLHVAVSCRNQGIGRQLLNKLEPAFNGRECYCLPYENLAAFYNLIGFEQITVSDAPAFLKSRYKSYIQKSLNIIIMKRPERSEE